MRYGAWGESFPFGRGKRIALFVFSSDERVVGNNYIRTCGGQFGYDAFCPIDGLFGGPLLSALLQKGELLRAAATRADRHVGGKVVVWPLSSYKQSICIVEDNFIKTPPLTQNGTICWVGKVSTIVASVHIDCLYQGEETSYYGPNKTWKHDQSKKS